METHDTFQRVTDAHAAALVALAEAQKAVTQLGEAVAQMKAERADQQARPASKLLTRAQACEHLGISATTLGLLMKSGELKFIPIGSGPRPSPRFRTEDLDAWAERSVQTRTAS